MPIRADAVANDAFDMPVGCTSATAAFDNVRAAIAGGEHDKVDAISGAA